MKIKPTAMKRSLLLSLMLILAGTACAARAMTASAPILAGFHPDPSVCRVGSDYYLCNSSFTWYPGLPIYHSTDLAHWELVAHAIDRPGMVSLDGVKDKDGVWAPTIRHHDGLFYIFCNVSNGGSFFIPAREVTGPWSDPVFVRHEKGNKATGIDPDIFWDDDGQAWYLSNSGKFPGRKHTGSTAIYLQKINLEKGTLEGGKNFIATGHAFNAKHAEGPHLYKIGGKYVLLVAEGGTDYYHAVTILTSRSITGPYLAQQNNPVLSNRQLGHKSPVQCVGHADLVQTPAGDWHAVCLGKRMVFNHDSTKAYAFTRETFIVPVAIEDGEFYFNPGHGCIDGSPMFPKKEPGATPPAGPAPSQGEGGGEALQWYYERIPHKEFATWMDEGRHSSPATASSPAAAEGGATPRLRISLLPAVLDSLVSPALVMSKVSPSGFEASARLSFQTKKGNEEAGIVLHRNSQAYIAVLKGAGRLRVVVCDQGRKTEAANVPCTSSDIVLGMKVRGLEAVVEYGPDASNMKVAARVSTIPLADSQPLNRFNGTGFGLYATSNGKKTKAKALFSDIAITQH